MLFLVFQDEACESDDDNVSDSDYGSDFEDDSAPVMAEDEVTRALISYAHAD